jgi:hypothetical protein
LGEIESTLSMELEVLEKQIQKLIDAIPEMQRGRRSPSSSITVKPEVHTDEQIADREPKSSEDIFKGIDQLTADVHLLFIDAVCLHGCFRCWKSELFLYRLI